MFHGLIVVEELGGLSLHKGQCCFESLLMLALVLEIVLFFFGLAFQGCLVLGPNPGVFLLTKHFSQLSSCLFRGVSLFPCFLNLLCQGHLAKFGQVFFFSCNFIVLTAFMAFMAFVALPWPVPFSKGCLMIPFFKGEPFDVLDFAFGAISFPLSTRGKNAASLTGRKAAVHKQCSTCVGFPSLATFDQF